MFSEIRSFFKLITFTDNLPSETTQALIILRKKSL